MNNAWKLHIPAHRKSILHKLTVPSCAKTGNFPART